MTVFMLLISGVLLVGTESQFGFEFECSQIGRIDIYVCIQYI